MITPVLCVVCGEYSHCYTITVPKKNPRQCPYCHHHFEPRTTTYDFCSIEHLKEISKNSFLRGFTKMINNIKRDRHPPYPLTTFMTYIYNTKRISNRKSLTVNY